MKLKSFRITRFGPVSGAEASGLGLFNLFYGPNEEGKTLVLEALSRLVSGKTPRDFMSLERVDENPAGCAVVEHSGRDYEFPHEGTLPEFCGISAGEFRNIFVIRNSDLSIIKEKEFYAGVADRLTGLKTEQVAGVKRRLLEIGKLTAETKNFRNVKDERLLDRLREAGELSGRAEELSSVMEEKDFDGLRERKFRAAERLETVERDIQLIQKAREREKYDKGVMALEEARGALDKLGAYEGFNEEDIRIWSGCLRDIERLSREKSGHKENLSALEADREKLEQKLQVAATAKKSLEGRKEHVEEEIKPLLKDYNELSADLLRKNAQKKFFDYIFYLSSFLLAVFAAGFILSPGIFTGSLSVLFLFCSAAFGLLKHRLRSEEGRLRAIWEELGNHFAALGSEVSSCGDALSEIRKLEEEHEKLLAEVDSLEKAAALNAHEISRIKDDFIPAADSATAEEERKIRAAAEKTGVDDIGAYREKLKERENLEKTLSSAMAVLQNEFGGREGSERERLEGWEGDVSAYAGYREAAPGVVFDKAGLDGLIGEVERLQLEIRQIEEELDSSERAMREIWKSAAVLLAGEGAEASDDIPCDSSADLGEIRRRLAAFIRKHDTLREDVTAALEIFGEIDGEEREKISGLFGEGSPVSVYFSKITSGRYDSVVFDKEAGGAAVRLKTGGLLEPSMLSGGAYDQLYLSVRLALGESLLEGEKGFFIMDDPFIKADSLRLRAQGGVLREVAAAGWQIIYFTAKDEVRDMLSDDIKAGEVNYYEAASWLE